MRWKNTSAKLLGLMVGAELQGRRLIVLCIGLEVMGVGLAALGPFLLKVLVDVLSSGRQAIPGVLALIAVFVVAWTGTSALSALRMVYSSRILTGMAHRLTTGALSGFLGGGRWRQGDAGWLQSAVERLPYSLIVVVDGLVWRTAPLLIQLLLSLVLISRLMSWAYLAGFVLLVSGFVAVSAWGVTQQSSKGRAHSQAIAEVGALIGDILKNARRVVSNGAVAFEMEQIDQAFEARLRMEDGVNWALVKLSGGQWGVMSLGLVFLLGLASLDLSQGRTSTGDFIMLQAYALRLMLPLMGVGYILSQSAGALENIAEVLAFQGQRPTGRRFEPQLSDPPRGLDLIGKDLSFSYAEGRSAFRDISVHFPPASFSVIVGENGSGKSTLAQVLAGSLQPSAGVVLFDGRPAETISEDDRPQCVLYVPQRSGLLNRELRANLLYPPAVHTAAEALAWLERWRFGTGGEPVELDRSAGEQGDALSGGQVQKLELARLMGCRVPCLILDESTSALDPASEARIVDDLRRATGQVTTLVLVTHRVALAQMADQVLWMQSGRLAATGGHDELLSRYPGYVELWG